MEYISSKIPSLGQNYTLWIIYIKQPFISAMVFVRDKIFTNVKFVQH